MKSETTLLVEEIFQHSNRLSVLMETSNSEDEAVSRLKEKMDSLWKELDSIVRHPSYLKN